MDAAAEPEKPEAKRLFNRLVARSATRVGLVGATHAGASPELALAAGGLLDPMPDADGEVTSSSAIDGFRREFDELLAALSQLRVVAVFIEREHQEGGMI
jgi:hypothetical protein